MYEYKDPYIHIVNLKGARDSLYLYCVVCHAVRIKEQPSMQTLLTLL